MKSYRFVSSLWIWAGAPSVAGRLSEMMYRTHIVGPGIFWGLVIVSLVIGGVLTWRPFDASRRERCCWLAVYLFSSSLSSVVISLVVAAAHGYAL